MRSLGILALQGGEVQRPITLMFFEAIPQVELKPRRLSGV